MTNKNSHFSADGHWRYDTDHSMLRRLDGHDYKGRSIYMLTITLADRRTPLLGSLRWGGEGKPVVDLSPLGERVRACWGEIAIRYPGVRSIALQIMPEHLHGILFVTHAQRAHLGQMVKGFKIGCSHAWWELCGLGGASASPAASPASPASASPSASPFSPSSASPFRAPNYNSANPTAGSAAGFPSPLLPPPPTAARSKGARGPSLFSPGYQDTVLTGKGQLRKMIDYVLDNPRRALIKRDNPDLFRVVRGITVGTRSFAAIGNQWLLDRPMRLQVRCHNNTSPENLQLIARQKTFFLRRGREGAVIVSPCISPGEKEIARAALEAHQPLIVILENGFPPLYKPPGRYFEACADGSLLMLAPWPYHTERRKITRWQCESLNAMAAEISTDPWDADTEWKLKSGGRIP